MKIFLQFITFASLLCIVSPAHALWEDTYEEFIEEARRCTVGCDYEIAGTALKDNDGEYHLVDTTTSLEPLATRVFESWKNNVIASIDEDTVELINTHTHPLSAYGSSKAKLFDSYIPLDEREKICRGERIPPAAQPSKSDWINVMLDTYRTSIINDSIIVTFKVVDTGGEWTFRIPDPKNDTVFMKFKSDMTAILDGNDDIYFTDAIQPLIDRITPLVGTKPHSAIQKERDDQIKALEAAAARAGLYLSYQPNTYTNGGTTIPGCIAYWVDESVLEESGSHFFDEDVDTTEMLNSLKRSSMPELKVSSVKPFIEQTKESIIDMLNTHDQINFWALIMVPLALLILGRIITR